MPAVSLRSISTAVFHWGVAPHEPKPVRATAKPRAKARALQRKIIAEEAIAMYGERSLIDAWRHNCQNQPAAYEPADKPKARPKDLPKKMSRKKVKAMRAQKRAERAELGLKKIFIKIHELPGRFLKIKFQGVVRSVMKLPATFKFSSRVVETQQ